MDDLKVEKANFHEECVSQNSTQMAATSLSQEDADFLANFSEDRKRKVLKKVDWRLVPMLLFLYLITYIDKVNIGNAKIEGLLPSLHMSDHQCT